MAQFIARIGLTRDTCAGAILSAFKCTQVTREVRCDWCSMTVLQPSNVNSPHFGVDSEAKHWIAWAGTWFHSEAPRGTAEELLGLLRRKDIAALARELEGFFALIIGDEAGRTIRVITDRCGSCHVFSAAIGSDQAISTSSAALASLRSASFDPIGVHEFVATGIVYGEHTLWQGVTKLPPASICSFDGIHATRIPYWTFAELQPERLGLNDAVEAVGAAVTTIASQVGKRFNRVVCDVTGGYDSRACLTGFLNAGVKVDATVSGPEDSGDVLASKEIARRYGLRHIHSQASIKPTLDDLIAATRLTDGEYDAFDYARIRKTHLGLSVDHDVSINGSFGELARGYWWELLFPGIARRTPLNVHRIVDARFAASLYDASIFTPLAAFDLAALLRAEAAESIRMLEGFPNTTQLDCVYFTLRMQRWQGRIASSTDQLWPCLSPFSFPSALVPVLESKASTRFGSRLVTHMIDRLQPELAAIDLEYGYPAQPVRVSNILRFAPLISHLTRRVAIKTGRVIEKRIFRAGVHGTHGQKPTRTSPLVAEFFDSLSHPLLLETGLFERAPVMKLMSGASSDGAGDLQSMRLMTLELLLRELSRIQKAGQNCGPDTRGVNSA